MEKVRLIRAKEKCLSRSGEFLRRGRAYNFLEFYNFITFLIFKVRHVVWRQLYTMELLSFPSTTAINKHPHDKQFISYSANYYGNIMPCQLAPSSTQFSSASNIPSSHQIPHNNHAGIPTDRQVSQG